MRISVAMAARNIERYAGALLESLVDQTQLPHELVVCDDGSNDGTERLLAEFAAEAPFPVRVVRHPESRGHVPSFMRAAGLCSGDVIAFCDHDDVWLPQKLETCVRELRASGATLVLHTTRVVDADLHDTGRTWPAITRTRTIPPLGLTGLDVHAPGMAMVVRREVLAMADFDSRPHSRYGGGRRMLHDEWVLFLAGVAGPIRVLAEPLLLYRQHDSNDSGGFVGDRRNLTLTPAAANYRAIAEHAAACAAYLESSPAADDRAAQALAAGAAHYTRMARNWALRLSLYRHSTRMARVPIVPRLVAAKAYAPRRAGGFGRSALVKDLAAGIALRATANAPDAG